MGRLKRTSDLVKQILQDTPQTRSDDDLLYAEVCRRINGIALSYSFAFVLMNRKEFGFPPFESVRRSRQKIQAHNLELCASDTVEGYRSLEEENYKNYARRKSV